MVVQFSDSLFRRQSEVFQGQGQIDAEFHGALSSGSGRGIEKIIFNGLIDVHDETIITLSDARLSGRRRSLLRLPAQDWFAGGGGFVQTADAGGVWCV